MTQRWAVVRRSGQEILYVDLLEGITTEDHARQEARYIAEDFDGRDPGAADDPSSTMTVHLHRITIHEDVDYLRERGEQDDEDLDQDPG